MCLTIPAKVIEIKGKTAVIDSGGVIKTIDIRTLDGLSVNDWVLYMSDIAVKRVSDEDAQEILAILEHTQKTDPDKLDKKFIEIVKASKQRKLTKTEIVYLLNTKGNEKKALFSEAEMLRKTYIKDFFCIHGIIEFSNYCKNDCKYCGLRKQNESILRYRMQQEEIVATVKKAVKEKGYKLIVLQSGEDPYFTKEKLVDLVKNIKKTCRVFIFMSIGERDFKTYKAIREAGAEGVLFRFETSNPDLFKKIHKRGKNFANRFKHLEFMKNLKFFIASGSLVGIPGQTIEDLANDIIIMRDNNFNMISMGPFVPCSNTPFENERPGKTDILLKMISILRLEIKDTRIPVVTAHETLDPKEARKKAIHAGANALMFNLTPKKHAPHYEIYKRKEAVNNQMWENYGLYNTEESYKMLEDKLKIE